MNFWSSFPAEILFVLIYINSFRIFIHNHVRTAIASRIRISIRVPHVYFLMQNLINMKLHIMKDEFEFIFYKIVTNTTSRIY